MDALSSSIPYAMAEIQSTSTMFSIVIWQIGKFAGAAQFIIIGICMSNSTGNRAIRDE